MCNRHKFLFSCLSTSNIKQRRQWYSRGRTQGNAVPQIFIWGNTVPPNYIGTSGNVDTVAFHQIGLHMADFKAKMHQIRFRLGLRPRPRWGSLQRSSRPLKVGFHYPSSRPEFTGRVHGPRTRVHFLTPVNSGRELG